jgi:GTPase
MTTNMTTAEMRNEYVESHGAGVEAVLGLGNATMLAAEVEEGNSEYKFKLTNITEETLQHRVTQLNWRVNEGNDEAIYQIGVEDDGNPLGLSESDMEESLSNLSKMASVVGCSLTIRQVTRLRCQRVISRTVLIVLIYCVQLMVGQVGLTAEVVLRRLERQMVDPEQVQIALLGDVDAGKSTLVGVLSTGKLDNGRGLARMQVCQYDHEVCSGQTSSVSQHNLCFSVDGNVRRH